MYRARLRTLNLLILFLAGWSVLATGIGLAQTSPSCYQCQQVGQCEYCFHDCTSGCETYVCQGGSGISIGITCP